MNEIVLVLDESGAKGYSDNKESHAGELGVMAGYMVPSSMLDALRLRLEAIRDQFATDGKLHITDLVPSQQEALRQAVYSCLQQSNLSWVYEATYVQGYHEQTAALNALTQQAHAARRSTVKTSWRPDREMLHASLFAGVFGKAIAYCIDHVARPCQISVVTDRTDESILKQFRNEANAFFDVALPQTHPGTGFDTVTKQVVHGTVTTAVRDPHGVLGDFSGVTYTLRCEDSALTLAADVLVNGLYYHLKNRPGTATGAPLHDDAALAGYPLEGLVYGTHDGTGFDFSDTLFGHPNRQ